MKKNNTLVKYRCVFLFIFIISCVPGISCKKFIEVGPPVTSISGENLYTDDANAVASITGIYAKMSATNFSLNLSVYPELSADNFELFSQDNLAYTQYYQNALISNYGGTPEFWSVIYNYIFPINDAISGLSSSTKITPQVRDRLLGEAYFLRSFLYFHLVNLYGKIPLALTTNYVENNKLTRATEADVYQQIIADSNKAKSLLTITYVDGTVLKATSERIRPNRSAVDALLSRVYLYQKNYDAAEKEASEVIQNNNLFSANIPLDQVFLANSLETIWSLQPVNSRINTGEAAFFIPTDAGLNSVTSVLLSKGLLESFELGDLRKKTWIDSINFDSKVYYFPSKYKVGFGSTDLTEYPIVLRLSEQYLIRSEARARLNNISGSRSDLNIIRNRAGLPETSANNTEDLVTAIFKERRVELFSEWSHRWFDLKRSGAINEVMEIATPLKGGGSWKPFKAFYPIPYDDVRLNTNLLQNEGYN